jgi:hypothetical protein
MLHHLAFNSVIGAQSSVEELTEDIADMGVNRPRIWHKNNEMQPRAEERAVNGKACEEHFSLDFISCQRTAGLASPSRRLCREHRTALLLLTSLHQSSASNRVVKDWIGSAKKVSVDRKPRRHSNSLPARVNTEHSDALPWRIFDLAEVA